MFDLVSISGYQYLIIFAWVVSLLTRICFLKSELWKFELFMSMVFFSEIVLSNYFKIVFKNNTLLFNLFFILCVNYYYFCFLIRRRVANGFNREYFVLGFWNLLVFCNFVFIQGYWNVNTYSWISGMLLIFISIIVFYKDLLVEHNIRLLESPKFILSVGVLGLYGTIFPLVFHMNLIVQLDSDSAMVFYNLVYLGNFILAFSYVVISILPFYKRFVQ